ncbi:MAG: YD repeat-containing protein [Brevundimonas sp.]|jgi:YD repeat-containing protein|uniref:hypothetical protein n=1 Tax=Brevundimonas sp. TaxID=1871086 RepID=UPI0039E5FD7C
MSRVLTLSVVLGMAAAVAVAQETTTYTYDVHGRLLKADRTTGPVTTYSYDGGNSRTSKVTTGGSLLMAGPEAEGAAIETDIADTAEDAEAPATPTQDETAQDD